LGNYYIGLLPQFNHRFLGVRYQFRSFQTHITGDASQFSRDQYQTVELWGGWNIGKRWQLVVFVPFNFVHQVSDDGVTYNQGFGDVAVMGNYKVFDKRSVTAGNKKISQQLWFGLGLKLPTGQFSVDPNDNELSAKANTQTGTASTDFIFNTMYNVGINKFGINNSVSYKLNTPNRDQYSFGNKFSASSIIFYSVKKKEASFFPNLGLNYEHTVSNSFHSESVAQTGGYLLSASAGVEVNIHAVTIGLNTQLPVVQRFATGQTETKIKGMAHITFSF
jgi:hypothetical protein